MSNSLVWLCVCAWFIICVKITNSRTHNIHRWKSEKFIIFFSFQKKTFFLHKCVKNVVIIFGCYSVYNFWWMCAVRLENFFSAIPYELLMVKEKCTQYEGGYVNNKRNKKKERKNIFLFSFSFTVDSYNESDRDRKSQRYRQRLYETSTHSERK